MFICLCTQKIYIYVCVHLSAYTYVYLRRYLYTYILTHIYICIHVYAWYIYWISKLMARELRQRVMDSMGGRWLCDHKVLGSYPVRKWTLYWCKPHFILIRRLRHFRTRSRVYKYYVNSSAFVSLLWLSQHTSSQYFPRQTCYKFPKTSAGPTPLPRCLFLPDAIVCSLPVLPATLQLGHPTA